MPNTWPASLPAAPEWNDYLEGSGNTCIRTNMEAGPPKIRQRFTQPIKPINMSFMLTLAQKLTFNAFYSTTLAGGSDVFQMTHPITGETKNFQFETEPKAEGSGGTHVIVRFSLQQLD